MVKVTPTTRGRIKQMHLNKKNNAEIGRELDLARETVRNIVTKGEQRGTYHSQRSPGRPPKYSKPKRRQILMDIKKNPFLSFQSIAIDHDASESTVRAIADENHIHRRVMKRKPHLKRHHIAARRGWTRAVKEQDWRGVIFTDETSLEMGEQRRQ